MSILKFENRTPKTLSEMVEYLTDESKTTEAGIFGIGCNPKFVVDEFELVQRIFFKETITHPYLQVIFSFDVGVSLPIQYLREICIKIGRTLITDKRQVFGAIHYLNTDKIHCHYLLNFVDATGKLYEQKYSLWHYKNEINKIIIAYSLNPIKIFEG